MIESDTILNYESMYQFYFQKLNVWQNSRNLASRIYQITRHFPEVEKFGITNQIRRAATSICANIAEGSGKKTGKDQSRFTSIAFASLMELMSFLIISNDLKYLTDQELKEITNEIEVIAKQLNSLKSAQLSKYIE